MMLKGEIKPHEDCIHKSIKHIWKVKCKSIYHIYKIDLKIKFCFIL